MAEEDTKVPEKILPPDKCIRFWESKLFHDSTFMSPETITFIEDTIKHLKTKGG